MPHESTSAFPFEDRTDFDDADRGFVGALVPAQVTAADGRVVWDNDAYDFLAGECPDTADPSLWRQGQLCARQGLYEVTPGIYQVRGLDISNMTIVEGDTGVIVIDPLTCKETAAAAVALYRHHRGDRPMRGLIYTHAHADHYGGAKGVLVDDVPILAPHGFVEAAVSENVYAGPAMTRRSMYMYGALLPKGPAGQIGSGLGQTVPIGTVGLVPPTVEITRTGQEEVIDGVVFRFQITPGTECPAEMNFLLPQRRALCMAENATHNLHNLLTLRGALVRDPRVWARYLNEAIALFCDDIDVSFASHHWPTWGRDRVVTYLSQQRDLYAYLHDQTLRLMNQGHTGIEIAEMLDLPPALEAAWHTHGYYGSVSHNVKAIYQRYMGWFDGNPASLWQHPPVERATRYLECMGGADAVIEHATRYVARGDLRFAVQLLNDVVFAEPDNDAARQALAGVYEQLGHGAENGTWRNFYLMGALELRQGISQRPPGSSNLDMVAALSIEQLFDAVAIRVDGPRAWDEQLTIDWNFSDLGETYRTSLSNGVLVQQPDPPAADVDLTLTLTKAQLLRVVFGRQLDGVAHEGDLDAVERLLGLLDRAATNFPIVTP